MTDRILIGKGDTPQVLRARYANRHGLVAGATGTGKTVTLQVLAEGFSAIGVPVFCADVKGDLSGLAAAGGDNPKLAARAAEVREVERLDTADLRLFSAGIELVVEHGGPARAGGGGVQVFTELKCFNLFS